MLCGDRRQSFDWIVTCCELLHNDRLSLVDKTVHTVKTVKIVYDINCLQLS